MWYLLDDDSRVIAFCRANMSGNGRGWIYCADVIDDPIEDDDCNPLYQYYNGHIVRF